jgi:hypothetical protein
MLPAFMMLQYAERATGAAMVMGCDAQPPMRCRVSSFEESGKALPDKIRS